MMKVCVIGGGQAGFQVCESMVSKGYKGKLTLISEEPFLPYQRPPLSKNFSFRKIKKGQIIFAFKGILY